MESLQRDLVAGVDFQYVMVTSGREGMEVWTADTLNDPFVYQSKVDTSMIDMGGWGWEFAMTQYTDNVNESPRLIADQLDFWVVLNRETEGQTANVMVTRLTARLTGGIFDP